MDNFRNNAPQQFAGVEVVAVEDYSAGNVNGLPKADVVKFMLADESWICVRPSGTEPKCKFYIGVKKESARASDEAVASLKDAVMHIVK